MELKPIRTRKIYEEIAEQLRKLVVEGKLKPGDRLPSERELAERLQVSRASVREALSALEMIGLLEVRSGEGTYIRHVNFDSVVAPLSWTLSLDRETTKELMEVRKVLEVQTVSLAVERATKSDLEELSGIIEEMRRDEEVKKFDEVKDARFHYLVAQATHNKILIRMMSSISDTIRQTIIFGSAKYNHKKLFSEHLGVYEAIRDKDPAAAKEKMLTHLVDAEKILLNS